MRLPLVIVACALATVGLVWSRGVLKQTSSFGLSGDFQAVGEGILLIPSIDDRAVFLVSEGIALKRVEKKFQIVNRGESRQHIKIVKTSCGCAQAKLDKPFIDPGEDLPFSVFLTAPRQGGERTATVELECVGVASSKVIVRASATFLNDVCVEPDSLRMDTTGGCPRTVTVHAWRRIDANESARSLPTIQSESCPPWLTCQIPAEFASRRVKGDLEEFEWSVDVALNSRSESADEEFGRIVFTAGELGTSHVSCWGDYRRGVVIAPARVNLTSMRIGETVSRRFVLRSRDSQPFELSSLTCSNPDVRLTGKTTDTRNVHIIEAQVTPSRSGEFGYPLNFSTTHRASPLVTTTIRGDAMNAESTSQLEVSLHSD
jgi:hypothetical protein